MAFRTKVLDNNSSGSLVFTWLARTSTELGTLFLGKPGIGNLAIIMNKPWGGKNTEHRRKMLRHSKMLREYVCGYFRSSFITDEGQKWIRVFTNTEKTNLSSFVSLRLSNVHPSIYGYSWKLDLNKLLAFSLSLISSKIEYSTKFMLPFGIFC
jgi:hypothetical protein